MCNIDASDWLSHKLATCNTGLVYIGLLGHRRGNWNHITYERKQFQEFLKYIERYFVVHVIIYLNASKMIDMNSKEKINENVLKLTDSIHYG